MGMGICQSIYHPYSPIPLTAVTHEKGNQLLSRKTPPSRTWLWEPKAKWLPQGKESLAAFQFQTSTATTPSHLSQSQPSNSLKDEMKQSPKSQIISWVSSWYGTMGNILLHCLSLAQVSLSHCCCHKHSKNMAGQIYHCLQQDDTVSGWQNTLTTPAKASGSNSRQSSLSPKPAWERHVGHQWASIFSTNQHPKHHNTCSTEPVFTRPAILTTVLLEDVYV